ncbi:MAG: outer membrane protein transport protein [Burkholderiales bacterium]|nr:outer membrane protein transport protein [Burkholderiales bacterium]
MRTKTIQRRLAAAAVGALFASTGATALASGFQIQEQGASGLGVAYSGQAAAVHDASTVFWNPAGMSLLPGKQGVAALHYIIPDTKFSDSGSLLTPLGLGNGGNGGESALVPAVYGTWMINPQWSVGLAVNAPFGLATEWDQPWVGHLHAIRSEITTLNINPTVSFKVNNMLSLGAGLSYQRLEAELTNAANAAGTIVGKVDGDDWAWGWNIGALIAVTPATRIGLTYRSSIKYTVEGDLTFNSPALAALQSSVEADVKLPQVFGISVSHQFTPADPRPGRLDVDRLGFDPEPRHPAHERPAHRTARYPDLAQFRQQLARGLRRRAPAEPAVAAARRSGLRHHAGAGRLPHAAAAGRRPLVALGGRALRADPDLQLVARLRLHAHLRERRVEQPAADRRTRDRSRARCAARHLQGERRHPRGAGRLQVLRRCLGARGRLPSRASILGNPPQRGVLPAIESRLAPDTPAIRGAGRARREPRPFISRRRAGTRAQPRARAAPSAS